MKKTMLFFGFSLFLSIVYSCTAEDITQQTEKSLSETQIDQKPQSHNNVISAQAAYTGDGDRPTNN